MSWRRILFAALLITVAGVSALTGALAGGVAVFTALRGNIPESKTTVPVVTMPTGTQILTATEIDTAITQAVEKVGPAVVTVISTIPGQVTFFGQAPEGQSSGSGVIISDQGYILTNNHVVEGATEVQIVLADETTLPAEVIGSDRYADLAIVRAQGTMPAVARLGNSDLLKRGETVIAIGSPLGDFTNTVTVGVVSATQRNIDTGDGFFLEGLIQTDAAINQGNSGGPLVNLAGEVIGINTLVVRGDGFSRVVAEGLGFAIPANTAQAVAEQIVAKGYFSRPFLGIQWQPINPGIARQYNLPVEWGAYVAQVGAGTPAERAGLVVGDIITRIGETPIDEDNSFINALFKYTPGEEITLEIVRDRNPIELTVTLEEHNAG